ncbi:hypothetical protein BTUL_0033g00390 [Botrytis tulipae]|uniref:Uncharacterized protein n=1 Tax=Botrytis tulipae TaxID=87230 RepID=A0A4Z1F3F7_9HELO|nr:hypothetical protein BTUL_0033g00390 [Botrytis tulipae]
MQKDILTIYEVEIHHVGVSPPDEPRGRTVTPSGEKGPNSYGVYLTRRPRSVVSGRGEFMSVVNIALFVADMLVLAMEVFEYRRETLTIALICLMSLKAKNPSKA